MIPQCNPRAGYLAHRAEIDAAIARVLQGDAYILGPEVGAFEQEFARAASADWSLGVANGTDAIEIALRACGVSAGDRVATVSHTAVATVAAIARIGALPLFVDIDPDRYTMCPRSLDAALGSPSGRACKAVVVVHLYGQPADIPLLLARARARGLAFIEDCAQAHGALLDGRPVGTWGDAGCFSFYPTKNLSAIGDGGAIVGNDQGLHERARLLRQYGWRQRYISEGFGLNSRLDELQAAILRVKLPHLEHDNHRREVIAGLYDQLLARSGLELPARFPGSTHVFHQYVVRCARRDELRDALRDHGVATLVHYPAAVHQQPAYSDRALAPVSLSHTEALMPHILSLPMFPELSDQDARTVCAAIAASLN